MDRIRYGYHDMSARDALQLAGEAGYRLTDHGRGSTVHVQRGLWRALTVTPVGSGVMVRRAWTTAQVIALGVVLTLIALGVAAG